MTRKQKHALAGELAFAAGCLCDDLENKIADGLMAEELRGVPVAEISEQLARWLMKLPGDEWDTRLRIRN
jgi:hypothetical protein